MDDGNTEHHEAFENEAVERGLVEDAHLDYEEWLGETGLDDSFVGMPGSGIPGTHDLYEAAKRVHARENANKP
jgi:hypothetical protein